MRALLVLLIIAELAAVGIWARRRATPPPPVIEPDLALYVDPITAEELERLRQRAARDTPDGWRELGRGLAVFGMFGEAEQCFLRATQLEPGAFDDLFWLGMVLDRLGRPEEAVEQFRLAEPLASGSSRAGHDYRDLCWQMIGREYLRLEDAERAAAAFRRAPGLLNARYELARLLVRGGQTAEAIELLDALIDEHPLHHPLYLLRARAHRTLGHARQAADDLDMLERADRAIRTDLVSQTMGDWEADYPLARLLKECSEATAAGHVDHAAQIARGVLRAHWRAEFAMHVIMHDVMRGRLDSARELLATAIARDGPIPFDVIQLGDLFMQAGDARQAFDLFDRSLLVADNTPGHLRLAALFAKVGDEKKEARHRALARHVAAESEFRQNRLEAARDGFVEALRTWPELPVSLFYLGECERHLGGLEAAERAYRQCLELDPAFGRAADGLRRLDEAAAP